MKIFDMGCHIIIMSFVTVSLLLFIFSSQQQSYHSVSAAFYILNTNEIRSCEPFSLFRSRKYQNLCLDGKFHRAHGNTFYQLRSDSQRSNANVFILHNNSKKRDSYDCVVEGGKSDLGESLPTSKDDKKLSKTTESVGLYVHIPFCRRRCRYCDFAIVPIGANAAEAMADVDNQELKNSSSEKQPLSTVDLDSSTSRQLDGFQKMEERYKKSVLDELNLISQQIKNSRDETNDEDEIRIALRSIYFGGGTPSLASVQTLKDILDTILVNEQSPFYVPNNQTPGKRIEISIEIDPGTFSLSKLQAFKEIGFNRLSLGVQSFDDTILEQIGRTHRRVDIDRSIDMIRAVFGENDANYSIDLISGLPGLNLAKWAETLEIATSLNPKPSHLSLYDLQIESGSVFGKWYKQDIDEDDESADKGANTDANSDSKNDFPVVSVTSLDLDNVAKRADLPSATDSAFMYKYASGYLRSKNYEHYEISSYALMSDKNKDFSEKRSRHNQIYWEIGSSWYAIGLGATSFVKGKRFARPRNMADYFEWLEEQKKILTSKEGEVSPCWLPSPDAITTLDDEIDFLLDIIITRLRTKEGLDLTWVASNYGKNFVDAILKGSKIGLDLKLALHQTNKNGIEILRLTDPSGFLFSNTILSNIFYEIDDLNNL